MGERCFFCFFSLVIITLQEVLLVSMTLLKETERRFFSSIVSSTPNCAIGFIASKTSSSLWANAANLAMKMKCFLVSVIVEEEEEEEGEEEDGEIEEEEEEEEGEEEECWGERQTERCSSSSRLSTKRGGVLLFRITKECTLCFTAAM